MLATGELQNTQNPIFHAVSFVSVRLDSRFRQSGTYLLKPRQELSVRSVLTLKRT